MTKRTLGRVLWRSFFLQAAWNYQGQQNLGFTAALQPGLESLHGPDSPAIRDALMKYLAPHNTQPYMAGPVLGSLLKAEEVVLAGGMRPEKLDRFRPAITAALAAIGDAFFWSATLPTASVIGLFWSLRGRPVGAVIFFILFNLAHLIVRVGGFYQGYRLGLEIIAILDRLHLPGAALKIRLFLSGVLGALAIWCLEDPETGWSGFVPAWSGLGAVASIIILARLIRAGWPVEITIYGLLAASLAWAYWLT
ncbi:MAG: PTS system mannose/fructose/sorbose family transporter subunit IID [Thermodesulfobacteriota bacterium]